MYEFSCATMPLLGAPTPPTVGSGPYTVDEVPMGTRYDVTHTHEHPENTLAGVDPFADSVAGAARRFGTEAVTRFPCR